MNLALQTTQSHDFQDGTDKPDNESWQRWRNAPPTNLRHSNCCSVSMLLFFLSPHSKSPPGVRQYYSLVKFDQSTQQLPLVLAGSDAAVQVRV